MVLVARCCQHHSACVCACHWVGEGGKDSVGDSRAVAGLATAARGGREHGTRPLGGTVGRWGLRAAVPQEEAGG